MLVFLNFHQANVTDINNAVDNRPHVTVSSRKCSFKSLIIRMRWIDWTKLAQAVVHMVRKARIFFNEVSGYQLVMNESALWILKLVF